MATTGEEDGRRAERTTRKQTHGRVSVHTAAGSTGQALRPNWGGHGTTLATAVLAAAAGPYRQSAAALAAAALATPAPAAKQASYM